MTSQHADGRVPALDGLRGLAIALVIWHNGGLMVGDLSTLPGKIFTFGANAGWVGVELFFVLSGFLITGTLADTKGEPHAWRNFVARRSLRIFPLYFLLLALFFVLLPLLGAVPVWAEKDLHYQVWYWTFLLNWSNAWGLSGGGLAQLWAVGVEQQFYLFWPLVVFGCTRRGVVRACAFLVISAIVLRVVFRLTLPEYMGTEAIYGWTVSRWDALGLGALLALLMRQEAGRTFLRRHGTQLLMIVTTILIVLTVWFRGIGNMARWVELGGQTLVAISLALLLAVVLQPGTDRLLLAIRGALEWSGARLVGKYSYAMYLFHLPIAHVIHQRLIPGDLTSRTATGQLVIVAGSVVLLMCASFLAGALSWRLIEAPFLRLKRHFAYQRAPDAMGRVAPEASSP